jgi:FkbM family methyltransferase
MIQHAGFYWPADVGTKYVHSLKHVKSLDWAIRRCQQKRTAVQAGGNIGLWPRKMAESFQRVITFEPDAISRSCLVKNVPANVEVRPEALGETLGWCDLFRQSLGSHFVISGRAIPMVSIDSLGLDDVDLLQLDIEGYEWHALSGARETIAKCHPIIQIEFRGFTEKYDKSDAEVTGLLYGMGYGPVSSQPGNDVVLEWGAQR